MGLKITGLVKFIPSPQQQAGGGDENLTIQNASYSGTSFDVSSQNGSSTGVTFNSTGTRMFVVGNGSDSVHQYTLGTGFDLFTASYDGVSFDVSGQDGIPTGIFFNSNGTRMFMVGQGNRSVYQYTLGTGFDLSTALYDGVSFFLVEDQNPRGIFFNNGGTKMFMVGSNNDRVYQYTLGTGFELSTATYDSVSFDISSQDPIARDIFFNSVGTKMFMAGAVSNSIHQYTLGTGFDLSTASYDSVSFDVSSQDSGPTGIFFNSGGTKMFIVGPNSDSVHEYNL